MPPRNWFPQRWRKLVSSLLASSLMAAIALGTYSYFTLWACVRAEDTTSSVVLAGAGAAVTGVTLTVVLLNRKSSAPQTEAAALSWVRQNRFRLPEDLALGQGPSIDDLAHAAGLSKENIPAFGSLLRENRTALFTLVQSSDVTGGQALEFFHRVGDLVASAPALASEFDAAKARIAQPVLRSP